MNDNRNMILAVVLSGLVLLGWQFFVGQPQLEAQLANQQQAQSNVPAAPSQPDGAQSTSAGAVSAPGTASNDKVLSRDAALDLSARVAIETPRVNGSINLVGARLDDLHLKDYRQTLAADSDTVILLSPKQSPEPYYADLGWVAGAGAGIKVPAEDSIWSLAQGDKLTPTSPVTLAWDNGEGLTFKRTITVDENYMFSVTQAVENTSGKDVTLYPYGLVVRKGEPQTSGYFVLHEGMIGVLGEDGLQEVDYSTLIEEGSKKYAKASEGWLGITDKYWATALVPAAGAEYEGRFLYSPASTNFQADYLGSATKIAAGSTAEVSSKLFAGAKESNLIDAYEAADNIKNFELMIDWGWFYFLTKPMFWLIDLLYSIVGNFGIAILLVTVLVKAVFFPLANKSYVSMSKMKLVQPKMQDIREKYKDDRAKQQQAMMELYKTEKINPMAGCLPMLIQIPVFFSLYKVLFVTIEMRHAPFFGWIQDLSAPDPTNLFTLFGMIPWDPPALLMLGIWPLIMGVTMFLQMKMNPAPAEPAQQMIFNWMPVMFTFMLASFPAGLVIYWAWNNSLSIAQQSIIMKRQGVKLELFDNLKSMFSRKAKEDGEKS
ncbi:membrane protein insertase YidC [Polycladidibacter hongkongensis]|uniref:membrane protein insertase YidC n=1 Tax=Polycladidibacter hongkongensis TaxID=1647556 RepID=UPI00082E58C7|nr:membrane protein insertase YidC [Pseudovibrio hongkongensis]